MLRVKPIAKSLSNRGTDMFGRESNPNGELWQPTTRENLAMSLGLLSLVVQGWACVAYVFLRKRFGESYFSAQIIFTILIILLYCELYGQGNPLPYGVLTLAWVIALCLHRFADGLKPTHLHPHSRYNGQSILSKSQEFSKLISEPVVVGGIGLIVSRYDRAFGWFLIWTALCIVLDFLLIKDRTSRRLKRLKDAEIEQNLMMDEYDRIYGDR
jgi:hypothetical protein